MRNFQKRSILFLLMVFLIGAAGLIPTRAETKMPMGNVESDVPIVAGLQKSTTTEINLPLSTGQNQNTVISEGTKNPNISVRQEVYTPSIAPQNLFGNLKFLPYKPGSERKYNPNRFIVKYKNENGSQSIANKMKDRLIKVKNLKYRIGKASKTSNFDVLTAKENVKPEDFISEIKSKDINHDIEYIQQDQKVELASTDNTPNDIYFSSQWALDNQTVQAGVYSSGDTSRVDANVIPAWNESEGDGVIVAVLDTGIDITHEDLSGNIWTNPAEVVGNGVDDDGDGYVDDVNGWNFIDRNDEIHSLDTAYDETHGTHVAGIIAAEKNNGLGIAGVAPNARIMPLKVFKDGFAYTSEIVEAIHFAESHGAKIVNCSWGTTKDDPALKEAIQESNMLFVCAAGNNGTSIDTNPAYPAAYKLDNVISVASVNSDGCLSSFSNFGAASVDVAAPGEHILSTMPENSYGEFGGTSMSAAFVSGEAALLLGKYRSLSASDIKQRITSNSDKLSSLVGKVIGENKINCDSAILSVSNNRVFTIVGNATGNYKGTGSVVNEGYSLFATGNVIKVVCGGTFNLALKSDATVWAWGGNSYGQLGDGTNVSRNIPIQVQGLTGIRDISCGSGGGNRGLALKSDGTVWSWGSNDWGQLGDGTTINRSTPVQVQGLNGIVSIGGGHSHSFAIKNDGTVWAWGMNGDGTLGDGTRIQRNTPVQIQGLSGIIAIAGGGDHSLALKNDGTVWSWGYNNSGVLGYQFPTLQTTPAKIQVLSGITAISCGVCFNLALKNDGTVWGWGMNDYGQLGDGTTTYNYTPTKIQGLNGIISIASGGNHSLALKSDGSILVWGYNGYGQLGDGTLTQRSLPISLQGLNGIKSINGGNGHSLILKNDGTAISWGLNYSGQLGDGTNVSKSTPVGAVYPVTPTNITTTLTSITTTLSWNPVIVANGYDVQIDGTNVYSTTGTSYQFTGLAPNSTHTYSVRSKTVFGMGDWSTAISATTAPAIPSSFSAPTITSSSIALSWGSVSAATSYDIEVNGAPQNVGNVTSYTFSSLSSGTKYTFRVRAKNANGIGDWSGYLTKWTLPGKAAFTTSSSTNSVVILSWGAVAGATGYKIQVGSNSILDVGNVLTYNYTGLSAYTPYTCYVWAYDSSGLGAQSDPLTVTTKHNQPGVPTGLTGSSTSSSSISISWTAVPGAASYDIQVDGSSTYVNVTGTSYTHSSLTAGTKHTYAVRANNDGGSSSFCLAISVWALPAAPTVTGKAATNNSITFTWGTVTGATGCRVQVDNGTIQDAGTGTSFTTAGLQPNTQHTYKVCAYNSSGSGAWSSPSSAWTLLDKPSNLSAIATSNKIVVSWQAVSGASKYQISIDNGQPVDVAGTTYTHLDLSAGEQHTYQIIAKNSINTSSWSEPITKSTLPAAPNVPTIAFDCKRTSISVSWNPIENAAGYDLMVDGAVVNNGLNTTYVHTGLVPGSQHTYQVRSRNASGKSSWSAQFVKSTLNVDNNVPVNLKADATDTSITVSWDSVPTASGYELEIGGGTATTVIGMSYLHENLTPGTSHTYRVRSILGTGTSDWSDMLSASTLAGFSGVPSNLRAEVSDTRITVVWDGVHGASAYDVAVDGNEDQPQTVNSAVYTHDNLVPGSTHTYKVRAEVNAIPGEWSPVLTKTANSNIPGVPQNIRGAATTNTITIVWDDEGNASSYDISIDNQDIKSVMSAVYEHENLSPDTAHVYKIRSRNEFGTSDWSSDFNISTLPQTSTIPANLRANAGTDFISVLWDAVYGAEEYEVQVDNDAIETVTGSVYNHNGLLPNTQHTYRVRSITGTDRSAWSTQLTASTPAQTQGGPSVPMNLRLTAASDSVTVMWDPVDGAEGYDVNVDDTAIETVTGAVYKQEGLLPGTQHMYRVRARNAAGAGNWSTALTVMTLTGGAGVPDNLTAAATDTAITVSWTGVAEATGYDINVDGGVVNNGTSTTYIHSGLLPGTVHIYSVRSRNSTGQSDWSGVFQMATLLPIPVNVTAASTDTSITVTWDSVAGADAYDVQMDGAGIATVTSAVYAQSGLIPNTQHTYSIRARNNITTSQWSQTVIKKTANNSCTVSLAPEKTMNFILSANEIEDFSKYTFTVMYDKNQLQVLDLNAATPGAELSQGGISGTNITVIRFDPNAGVITLALSGTIPQGSKWTGIVDSIRFKSKLPGGNTVINYEINRISN